jgi:hypothetical protein
MLEDGEKPRELVSRWPVTGPSKYVLAYTRQSRKKIPKHFPKMCAVAAVII